jgi:hypothetical protein
MVLIVQADVLISERSESVMENITSPFNVLYHDLKKEDGFPSRRSVGYPASLFPSPRG